MDRPACPHPEERCAPVQGKICTYLCAECGVEFTRARPSGGEAPVLEGGALPGVEPQTPNTREMKREEKQMMHQLCTVAQQTFSGWRAQMMEQGACPNSDSMLACAMATYTGTLVGELVALGFVPPGGVATMLDALRLNMEAGVGIGRKHVARCADQFLQEEAKRQGTERKQ